MQCHYDRRTIFFKRSLAFAVLMAAVLARGAGWADTPVDPLKIHETEREAIAIGQQAQQAEDRWAEEKAALQTRYRTLQAEEKRLNRQHAGLQDRVAALEDRQAEAQRTIAEAARVEAELQTHLDLLMDRLAANVDRDLPFLPDERSRRMAEIKTVLAQPDTGIAEHSRRVMEAIKVETEYGQTVDIYQQRIPVGDPDAGQALMADILRVGKLALFWRSPDGKRVGQWDRVENRWTPLPDKYRRAINDAVEMALKRRTIDMVKLPLGRIAQQ